MCQSNRSFDDVLGSSQRIEFIGWSEPLGEANRLLVVATFSDRQHAGVSTIIDLIVKDGLINLDFADVRSVMKDMGSAIMGTGDAIGPGRAAAAAEAAIANPLFDGLGVERAEGVLVSVSGGREMTLFEIDEAVEHVRQKVDPEANIIVGAIFDETLGEAIRVSLVATGLAPTADIIQLVERRA